MSEHLEDDLRRMRDDWDRRARENARHYVATSRTEWSDDEFFASGRAEVAEQILNDMENICQGRDPKTMRILEIGCGAGRVTRALAEVFGEVHAVDVSGEMVALARKSLQDLPNVTVYQNNGMDLSVLPDLPFDFAFSIIVFQHIPSWKVVESYFREVRRRLRGSGLFKVQVLGQPEPDASPAPIRKRLWRIRQVLNPAPPPADPDAPDTWIGVKFTPNDARRIARRCGFELRHQHGAGEELYWLWCFKR